MFPGGYLSRYTHRVAISNRRLIAFGENGATLSYQDYRRSGPERQSVMTLATEEFIRRFLIHVLPKGFHRIRHYGLLAASSRKTSIPLARLLLDVAPPPDNAEPTEPADQASRLIRFARPRRLRQTSATRHPSP